MRQDLSLQITELMRPELCASRDVFSSYKRRLEEGNLLRSQNATSHFCVYFLPYNRTLKQVFMVHHKKSGLWLFPGGHIEDGETVSQAVVREVREELGDTLFKPGKPFLLSLTVITNLKQICRQHFDIWFWYATEGEGFTPDPREFLDTQWMTVSRAALRVTDPNTLLALKIAGMKMST